MQYDVLSIPAKSPLNVRKTVCYNPDIYHGNVAVTAQKDVRTKVIAGAFPPAPCCQRVSDDICECVVEAGWRERVSYGARWRMSLLTQVW